MRLCSRPSEARLSRRSRPSEARRSLKGRPICGPLIGTTAKCAVRRLPLRKINVTIWKVLVEARRSRPKDAEQRKPQGLPFKTSLVRNESLCSALLRKTVRNGSFNQGVYRSTHHVRGLWTAVHLHRRRARVLCPKGFSEQAEPLPGLPGCA